MSAAISFEARLTFEQVSTIFNALKADHPELWEEFVHAMKAPWTPWTRDHPARVTLDKIIFAVSSKKIEDFSLTYGRSFQELIKNHLIVLAQDYICLTGKYVPADVEPPSFSAKRPALADLIEVSHPGLIQQHRRFRAMGLLAGADPDYLKFRIAFRRVIANFQMLRHLPSERVSIICRQLFVEDL